jgi:hypothetical protein
MSFSLQILFLFIPAIPIASVAWTITHEEVIREFHDFVSLTARPAAVSSNANVSISSL